MISHCGWFATLYLIQIVRAAPTNVSSTDTGSPYNATYNYRSVWSILASCGLTLLICVWHAIHPVLPPPNFKRYHVFLFRLSLMLLAFFAPELMILSAFSEWLEAREIRKRFRDDGCKWWTMTHSHFVIFGGFALHDGTSTTVVDNKEFLSLVKAGDIINPVLLERDIKDRGNSDGLAKAILAIQLIWFGIQLIVRLANHLSVTLVELDTVCMALLTLPLLFFWWEKPRCADYPHVFHKRNAPSTAGPDDKSASDESRNSWKEVSDNLKIRAKKRNWDDLLAPSDPAWNRELFPFLLTWSLLFLVDCMWLLGIMNFQLGSKRFCGASHHSL